MSESFQAEMHYVPHEDRMYVKRYDANEAAVARLAKIAREHGGARTLDWGRMAATIPNGVLFMADRGEIYDGKYRGIQTADKQTRQILMAQFLKNEGRMYLVNDTKRGQF